MLHAFCFLVTKTKLLQMSKIFFLQRSLKFIFAVMLGCICSFPSGNAFAAGAPMAPFDQTVTGTVRDNANGNPLQGATVSIKGGTKSTTTDAKGTFTISVPGGSSVLVIDYIGYESQELTVGSRTNLSISLVSSATELNQVVVVGYGTQRKKDVTGSVKSLRSESFNKGIINAPQQLLQGKVAGVNVTSASGEPGAIQGISIRGPGGIRTGSTPLFVVDGLPLDNSSTGGGDPLNFINTADIESMDVLKDASATAIYGARGANGVIIITTKKGKAGTSLMSYNASVGFSKIAKKMGVLSAADFRTNVTKVGGALDDGGSSTDWQDVITRSAITQNHNLTLSGGSDKLTYYGSFGLQKQEGIIKANSLDRYSGRMNVTQRLLDDKLTVEVNLNYSATNNKRPPSVNGMIGDAITNNPTYAATDANGKFIGYNNFNNPLLNLALDKDITDINRLIGSISATLKLAKGLSYKFNYGIDNATSTRDVEALPFLVPVRIGRLDSYYGINRNTLVENYLTYNFTKGKNNFSALAGHSYQKIFVQTRSSSISTFPISQIDPIYNPGIGQTLTLADNKPSGTAYINELQSFFGRVTYSYDGKYLLTANFRADGSSKFGTNNKYGYFPSFSLGWKISDESFMKNSIFSNLKLRAGWGSTGNQEIQPKITQPLFQILPGGGYPLAATGPYPAGLTYTRLANPDIQWESSKQTDLGLDFSLFKGALTGTIDVFNKVSNNILLQITPPDPVQPAATTWSNIKDMKISNKGLEIELDYNHRSTTGIGWNLGGNITFIKNNVTGSPASVIPSGSAQGSGLTGATINGYINGQPIGTFFLKEWTGIGSNGLSTFRDLDGDGAITDKDRIAAGTALPKTIFAFYGGLTYKGFDLNVNFNGVSGNKIYDNTANSNFYKLKLSKNVNVTPEAFENTAESINNSAPVSTRYLYDGAYLRLNNLALGYTFNTSKLGIGKYVSAMRLSITGQNLFVITKYKGFDPEVNTDRAIESAYSYGIDYLSYPKARTFIIGLNISF
jgi:TonB-linked SusC/RagA family outer membrane protein